MHCWTWRVCVQTAALLCLVSGLALAAQEEILMKPKDLHLTTPLVSARKPTAAILLPSDRRYDSLAERLQGRVKALTGVSLPIRRDSDPRLVLKETHALALGNLATSPFVAALYRHYYTYVDFYYPGRGGYVIHSVHNPYGLGHNVILLGGSDDAGVAAAVEAFLQRLGSSPNLQVGWLLEVRLGEGLQPPAPGEPVPSWADSGDRLDYRFFGWNPINVDLALYFMTGNPAYIEDFRKLLFPKGDFDPRLFDGDHTFEDPKHPLGTVYHYRGHLTPLLWDLVEESPVFTDAERQRMTEELLLHQKNLNLTTCRAFAAGRSLPDRHAIYEILCVWTGSRYFAYSYPDDPQWVERMRLAADAFALSLATPASNTPRIATATVIWPILEFALLSGTDEYYRPGGVFAQRMEKWLCLGDEVEFTEYSHALAQAAAYVLRDGRFLSVRPLSPESRRLFRIGQSYLAGIEPAPITGTTGLRSFPMAEANHRRLQMTVPLAEAFEFLSYRSATGPEKQHLFLYGYYERSKSPPRVNCVLNYEHAGAKVLRTAAGSGVVVVCNGMREDAPSMAAACRAAEEMGPLSYARTAVPDHDFSEWERLLFLLKDRCAVVFDRITARQEGNYHVAVRWVPSPLNVKPTADGSRWSSNKRRCAILCADSVPVVWSDGALEFVYQGPLTRGASRMFRSVLATQPEGEPELQAVPFGPNAVVVRANGVAVVGTGALEGPLQAEGEAFAFTPEGAVLIQGKRLQIGDRGIRLSAPATLWWDLQSGDLLLKTGAAPVTAMLESEMTLLTCLPGQKARARWLPADGEKPGATVQQFAQEVLRAAARREPVPLPTLAKPEGPLQTVWRRTLDGAITALEAIGEGEDTRLLVGTEKGAALLLNAKGDTLWQIETGGPVYALASAERRGQPIYFVGSDDEHVYALDEKGKVLWRYKARVSEWMATHHVYWTMGMKAKVRRILPVDVEGDGKLDLFIGTGGAAIERLNEEGQPQWLFTFRYGTPMSLVLADVRADHPGPELIAGTFDVSYDPMVRYVDPATGEELPGAYINRYPAKREGPAKPEPASFAQGNVWMRLHPLGEGKVGLLRAVCGENWNNLVMNDAATGACLWGKSFGPASGGGRLGQQMIQGMAVLDVDGDDVLDVVVGLRTGWMCAYRGATGDLLWARCFPAPITALAAVEGEQKGLLVGCQDGHFYHIALDGNPTHVASLEGAPAVIVGTQHPAMPSVVGTRQGVVESLRW